MAANHLDRILRAGRDISAAISNPRRSNPLVKLNALDHHSGKEFAHILVTLRIFMLAWPSIHDIVGRILLFKDVLLPKSSK